MSRMPDPTGKIKHRAARRLEMITVALVVGPARQGECKDVEAWVGDVPDRPSDRSTAMYDKTNRVACGIKAIGVDPARRLRGMER